MSAFGRARLAVLLLAAGLAAMAVVEGSRPAVRSALIAMDEAQARLGAAKRQILRLPEALKAEAEVSKKLASFKGKAAPKELTWSLNSVQRAIADGRRAAGEIRALESGALEAEAKAKPFQTLAWVLDGAVRLVFAAAVLALGWFLPAAWRLERPLAESLPKSLWVIGPALLILALIVPCYEALAAIWDRSESAYQSGGCLAAGALLLAWFVLRFLPARTRRAFGGGAWDWNETAPGRLRAYVCSRRFPADLLLGLLTAVWLVLALLACLTLIVLFPAIAGAAASWTAAGLSLACAVAMGLRAKAPAYHAFGIALQAERPSFARPVLQLAAMALAVRLLMWGGHAVNHGRFEAFKAGLKSRGVAVSLAEFQNDAPDGQYGEAAFTAALAKLDPKNAFNAPKHPGLDLKAWTRATAEAESASLKEHEPIVVKEILPLTGRYSRYKKIDLAASSKDPWLTPIPKFAELIKAGKILQLCAGSRAFQKEPAKAWAYVRAQLDLADMVSGEYSLIGKMIAVALRRQAVQSVLIIGLTAPEASLPKDVAKRLESGLDSRLVLDGLRGELAIHLDARDWLEGLDFKGSERVAGMIFTSEETGIARVLDYAGFRAFILMGALDLNALALSRRVAAYAEAATWPQVRSLAAAEQQELEALPAWPYLLAAIAAPRFAGLLEKEWELKTWTRMALTAGALNDHRKGAGKLPAGLAALAPKRLAGPMLVDVFTGKSFDYRTVKGGYELCSAGPKGDRKDSRGDRFCVVRD